jgi:hypothetical protein
MQNFCTLFDSLYLSRGVVMYESLKRNTADFHLFIFAFDDLAYEILTGLKLEKVTVISLSEFENHELLKVKQTRTKAEYCWTCTPSTIAYVLKTFNVVNCTYIDADLFFYKSPDYLTRELIEKKTVLITEHRYSKWSKIYEQKRAGRYCVQFITFTNDPESQIVLNKWKDQCIEWCFARYEDGKFGDQKYLDEWTLIYPNVHVMEHLGGGVAPWNVQQYLISSKKGIVYGIEKKTKMKFDVIFFHFHFVRFGENNTVDIGWHYLSKSIISIFYKPYIKNILETENKLRNMNPNYKPFLFSNSATGIKEFLKITLKQITRYNIIHLNKL